MRIRNHRSGTEHQESFLGAHLISPEICGKSQHTSVIAHKSNGKGGSSCFSLLGLLTAISCKEIQLQI
ncbi:hypothetical protein Y1Q_0008034 [Alligator mississippiensis]|uniref:Uncharacterized protein n=1 Tax=Alligator mississippiensis TaxID=8496 RepID=A0A151NG15_ALLMI|nr:hypothetical protein Y1Q_0008034 [Alligator mississippiensis]